MTCPTGVDHLIYAVPDLTRGMDRVERLLGVRPVVGGRHPAYGTHNALLSLGPETYLEVMAADPALDPAGPGVLFDLDRIEEPRLVTWVLRSESIERLSAHAASEKVGLGPVAAGFRERSDGTVLSWKLTDPRARPLEGAVPFLIAWGDSPHPASAAPVAGRLTGLRAEHPRPDRVIAALRSLGVDMDVQPADAFRLRATIDTPEARVELS